MRRQQAQEESEARELGLQLQYNNGSCATGPVMPPSSSSSSGAAAPTSTGSSPPPNPGHGVSSPGGLGGIPAAAAVAAAAAAAQIQTQLQQHQQPDCAGLLQRMQRVPQDDYRQTKIEKNDGGVTGRLFVPALDLWGMLLFR